MTDIGQPKPRLFDTPYDALSVEEADRLKKGAMQVIGTKPILAEPVAVRSVGVVGDAASYDPTLFLNPAPWHTWSVEEMGVLSTRIINEVPGIGRVLVDITPPKTDNGS